LLINERGKAMCAFPLAKSSEALANADGPLVFEFVQTLVALDGLAHGVAAENVSSVEAAWGYTDTDFYWIAGFAVRLRDGKRAYLHGFCDADTNHHAARVEVAFLKSDEAYNSCAPRTLPTGKPIVWEEAPERLNYILSRITENITDDTGSGSQER
jgi:hypothetical protein